MRKASGRAPRRARALFESVRFSFRKRTEPLTRSHGSRGPAAGGVPVDFAPPAPPSSQAERGACLAPLLNDLDFSPNADAERGKRRFSCQWNFHCLIFRYSVGLRAARRRFQCQENSSCFLGGKRAVTKEIQSFIRAKQFVSIVLIKTSPRGSILVEGSLHRLARKSNQQSVRVRDVLHCP